MHAPQILHIASKKLLGISTNSSSHNNQAAIAWSQFMPRRKEIKSTLGSQLFAVHDYGKLIQLDDYKSDIPYITWASIEVHSYEVIPDGMHPLEIEGGQYAVFIHRGSLAQFQNTIEFIYGTWLPNSAFEIDNRKHFEILGNKYLGPQHPDSEEEVWIPIKQKSILE